MDNVPARSAGGSLTLTNMNMTNIEIYLIFIHVLCVIALCRWSYFKAQAKGNDANFHNSFEETRYLRQVLAEKYKYTVPSSDEPDKGK